MPRKSLSPEQKERYRLWMAERRKDPAVRAKDREYAREWRARNPEKHRETSRKARARFCADGTGKMYFVQAESGPIKIGFTTKRMPGRLQELQCGSHETLRVLAAVESTPDEEKRTHDMFVHLRIRGEWFRPLPELLEFIATRCVTTSS